MIKTENINARVQKALFRRIEAVNKLKLKGTNKDKETFLKWVMLLIFKIIIIQ